SIAVLGVAAMLRHPAEYRSLHGHGAKHREKEANHGAGFEALVREEPVEPDGDAERRNHIHADQESEFDPAEPPAPERGDGDAESHEWKHDGGDGADA